MCLPSGSEVSASYDSSAEGARSRHNFHCVLIIFQIERLLSFVEIERNLSWVHFFLTFSILTKGGIHFFYFRKT